jgi:hypothetical protein
MKKYIILIAIIFFITCLAESCDSPVSDFQQKDVYPSIYPDYINVTIPYNISPLNFKSRGTNIQRIDVVAKGHKTTIHVQSHYKIAFPVEKWKKLLLEEKDDSVIVTVSLKENNKWIKYKSFYFYVAKEPIDPYLSYRLIEPGYEVWNKLSICQRNIETFKENRIVDNNLIDDGCVNCHTYCVNDPNRSFFHVRNKKGGTFLNINGKIRKINTKTEQTLSALVYGNWHPGGNYIAFSTNIIIPEFYTSRNKRLEVYDTQSDVVVFDINKNLITTSNLISGDKCFETSPVFSADGHKLYFCSALAVKLPDQYKSVRYSLCSIDFDPESGRFGNKVDTLISSYKTGKSVCLPKVSPDGNYILYVSADYGNFPIWHNEADLKMLNLKTCKIDNLEGVNGKYSDSYHCWSSNSRWFVFASKRDNGMYGKPYFSYIDKKGNAHKPFLLPQKDADFYDMFLKSFNIPELSKGPVPFDAFDVQSVFEKKTAEAVKFQQN